MGPTRQMDGPCRVGIPVACAEIRSWLLLLPAIALLALKPAAEGAMRDWGFWEWLAYSPIVIAAVMLAIRPARRKQPDRRSKGTPAKTFPRWPDYVPLALLIISFLSFMGIEFGVVPKSSTPTYPHDCMTFWGTQPTGIWNRQTLLVVADGNCFAGKESKYQLSAVALHAHGVRDPADELITVRGDLHDIQRGRVAIVMTVSGPFLTEVDGGDRGTVYFLLLVPAHVSMGQFSTLREAKNLGVQVAVAAAGPP
jgi:hypothetical protein